MKINQIQALDKAALDDLKAKRKGSIDADILSAVEEIIAKVRQGGDEALRDFSAKFDSTPKEALANLRVSKEEIDTALDEIPEEMLETLSFAAEKIADFHSRQLTESWFNAFPNGALVGSQITPLKRVGIYVPGGRAYYPSTVLMNALPALVAGVCEIAMVTPAREDGSVHPITLAAAAVAGVDEIYKVGGAHSVAALAYGTKSIAPVDKIVGPGNIYVAAAKYLVQGDVGIDMIAGPSEVLIIADESADPEFIAIDLMAQAEHDPRALTYLVTHVEGLKEKVEEQLDILLARSTREEITRQALSDNCVVVKTNSLDESIDISNMVAPEHLEVQTKDPLSLLGRLENAGAIFLGSWTPESIGDYIAGPNHVLPTGGTARYSNPLSTNDFVKRSSVLRYSPEALLEEGIHAERLAEYEGLWAHGEAVTLRLKRLQENS